MRFSAVFLILLAGCSSNPTPTGDPPAPPTDSGGTPPGSTSTAIVPGVGVGELKLGDTYGTLRAKLGAAESELGFNRLVFGRWTQKKLEIVFASREEGSLSDDAIALAIGVERGADVGGVARPGMTRAELLAALGAPSDEIKTFLYWPSGVSAQLNGDVAERIATITKYVPETAVAEMVPSKGSVSKPLALDSSVVSKVGAVDMHLHPGRFGRIPVATRKVFVSATPAFTQLYSPAVITAGLDAYAPFVGVKAQTDLAKVEHALLFAVYTQKTTGWLANEDLEAILTDPRNVASDGLPWAFGLASINFFDGYVRADGTLDAAVAKARLDALGSYFERRRDLFIGIKLAHPHQQVAFDDARYLGVYEVAAKHAVPVYLHTGFSPFEGAKNERAYYDPEGLRNTIKNNPKVKFILGHVGQGDALAVEHCLALATELPNVFLEISALNRPILRDVDGEDVPPATDKPLYPYVLEQVKKRGLVDKTLFGTDGPQYAGMVRSYVTLIRESMKEKGYTDDEIAKVMSRNFFAVFFGAS